MTLTTTLLRLILILFLTPLCFTSVAQTRFSGLYLIEKYYKDIYLNLYEDTTFKYSWRGHMWSDKSNGTYKTNGDTIFLTFRPFQVDTGYDNGESFILPNLEVLTAIDRPVTLFYSKDKLYRIENGQIVNRTQRNQAFFIKTKGWRKYYRRQYYFFGPYISKKRKIHYLQKFE